MTLAAAEKFLECGEQGFPIVFAGDLPAETSGFDKENDSKLKEILEKLIAMDNVVVVASESEVPSALFRLGVTPAMEPDNPSEVYSVRRYVEATSTDYYFLYNQGIQRNWYRVVYEEPETMHSSSKPNIFGTEQPFAGVGESVTLSASFEGVGQPFLLDANSGEITPIVSYQYEDGRITITLELGRDETKLLAITNNPEPLGFSSIPLHITASSAEGALRTPQGDAGRYQY